MSVTSEVMLGLAFVGLYIAVTILYFYSKPKIATTLYIATTIAAIATWQNYYFYDGEIFFGLITLVNFFVVFVNMLHAFYKDDYPSYYA